MLYDIQGPPVVRVVLLEVKMFYKDKRSNLLNQVICMLVLGCFVACNANYKPSFKQ